jgi:hypothetical protein
MHNSESNFQFAVLLNDLSFIGVYLTRLPFTGNLYYNFSLIRVFKAGRQMANAVVQQWRYRKCDRTLCMYWF